MTQDRIILEVRQARERLSSKYDHNPNAIFEDIRKREAKLGDRLVISELTERAGKPSAPKPDYSTLHPGR